MNFTEAIVLAVEKVKAWIQSGGVKWDHVSDKPFVKVGGDTLTWDGNTEGLVSVADTFYKVSDAVPTADDVVNGAAIEYADGSLDVSFTDTGVGVFIDTLAGSCVIVLESGIGVDVGGMAFPETGVYFNGAISVSSLTIPGYTGFAKEQIDPKVLPEALQFGKTTVQGDTLEWDGNTEGLETFQEAYYKVSDAAPTMADLANGVTMTLHSNVLGIEISETISAENIGEEDGFIIFINSPETQSTSVIIVLADVNEEDFSLSKGTYFIGEPAEFIARSLTIPGYSGFTKTEIKPIKPEYLPDSVKGGDYVVNFTANGDGTYSADKTFAEVQEQIEAGNAVSARLVMGENVYVSTTYFFNKNMGVEFALMSAIAAVMSLHFGLLPDNTVNITTFTLTATPMGGAS